jgi:hypothetical protein
VKIAFACPALNDEALLRKTVERTLPVLYRLIIVDDGSVDRTGQIAEGLAREHPDKIEVIRHPKTMGVGGAVKSALRLLCAREDVDAVGVITPGHPCDSGLVERFREALESMPEIDVAKDSRSMRGSSLESLAMQLALGFWGLEDPLHGCFLVRADTLRQMDLDAVADGDDFGKTMLAELRRLRATFVLVPSAHQDGETASKSPSRTPFPRTLATVTSMVMRRAASGPDRLGMALLLMSVPTFGATLPLAMLRVKQTSPRVKKLR